VPADLHCHILPGLDDGALDLDDSVAMAAQADEDGIATICATPHLRHDHDVVAAEVAGRVDAVNAELERRGLAARVVPGGEVAEASLGGIGDDELAAVSLGGGGRWILLEPAPGPMGPSLTAAVGDLGDQGYRALIAHPERHLGEGSQALLAGLVARGALIQMTAALMEDEHAGPTLLGLARRGLLHVLGSDAHSSRGGRPVRLSGAIALLRADEQLAEWVNWMVEAAPRAILEGRDIEPPYPALGG
jgi:protein-tyrosine phosphatase